MKKAALAESRPLITLKDALERLYEKYNRQECIPPDPLQFVYRYEDRRDREVAGLIASSLAYGRVAQIYSSVDSVLGRMGPSPSDFLRKSSGSAIRKKFADSFQHRFTTGAILSGLLEGMKKLISEYGALESCFLSGFDPSAEDVLPALCEFVEKLEVAAGHKMPMFIPSPAGGSACKRLNLFMRWMVRRDKVDPGVWTKVSPEMLLVPMDTHMHRIALALGLTNRKQADLRSAVEVTDRFSELCPEDPVRYDFCLTRLGITNDAPPEEISRFFKY